MLLCPLTHCKVIEGDPSGDCKEANELRSVLHSRRDLDFMVGDTKLLITDCESEKNVICRGK